MERHSAILIILIVFAATAFGQSIPGFALVSITSGAGAPGNPCATTGGRYINTSTSPYSDYYCPVASGNWVGPTVTGSAPAISGSNFTSASIPTSSLASAPTGSFVGSGQANTWTTGLQDFSGATWKIPTGAGFTASASSMFGYDSTAGLPHIWFSAADAIFGTAAFVSTGTSGATLCKLNANCTFTGTVAGITATMVGLSNVTNDAQAKASIWPNTAPASGYFAVGNTGSTAYAAVAMSGDCTLTYTGAIACTKTSGNAFTSASYTAIGTSGATIPLLSTANTWTLAQTISATTNQLVLGATNTTTLSFPAPASSITLTMPIVATTLIGESASDTTVTHVLHATANSAVGTFSAIVAGDLPSTLMSGTAITNAALTTPNFVSTATASSGAALGTTTNPVSNLVMNVSGTYGTGSYTFAGTPTANRTITLPDASITVTQTVASGVIVINPGAVASGSCSSAITATATGAASTDNVMLDFAADPTSTTGYQPSATGANVYLVKYLTTNTLNVKVCNSSASSVTPGSITPNWRIVR